MNFNIQYLLSVVDNMTPKLKEAQKMIRSMDKSLLRLGKTVNLKIDVKQAKAALKSLKAPELKATIKAADQSIRTAKGSAGKHSNGRHGGEVFGTVIGAGLLSSSFMQGLEIDKVLTKTAKAGNLSKESLAAFKNEFVKMSNATGQSTVDVATMANEWLKLDSSMPLEKVMDMTRITNAASMAWDMSAEQVSGALVGIGQQFNLNSVGLEDYANKIDLIADSLGGVSESYLADFAQQNAGVAKSVMMSKESMTAFAAAAEAAKADGGMAGNTMKHLAKELTNTDHIDVFKKLGLGADFVNQAKKDMPSAVGQILSALKARIDSGAGDGLDIASSLIGNNFDDTLLQIAGSASIYTQAQQLMGDSAQANGRIMKGLDAYTASAAGKFDIFKASMVNATSSIFAQNGALGKLLDLGTGVMQFFGRHPEMVQFAMAAIGVATAVSLIGFASSGVMSGIRTLTGGLSAPINMLLDFKKASGLAGGGIQGMASAAAGLVSPVGLAIAAVAALGYLAYASNSKYDVMSNAMGRASSAVSDLGKQFNLNIDAGKAWDAVLLGVNVTIGGLITVFTNFVDGVLSGVKGVSQAFSGDFSGAWDTWKGSVERQITRYAEFGKDAKDAYRKWDATPTAAQKEVYGYQIPRTFETSPIAERHDKAQAIKKAAGLPYSPPMSPTSQSSTSTIMANSAGAQVAQAAQEIKASAVTNAQTAQQNTQVAETMMAATSKQSDASSQLGGIIGRFEAAVNNFAANASNLKVTVAGGLGDNRPKGV